MSIEHKLPIHMYSFKTHYEFNGKCCNRPRIKTGLIITTGAQLTHILIPLCKQIINDRHIHDNLFLGWNGDRLNSTTINSMKRIT